MSLYQIVMDCWDRAPASADLARILSELEAGKVLFLPSLPFSVTPGEASVFAPAILSGAKNASYDPRTERLGGTTLTGPEAGVLAGLMKRFSKAAATLIDALLPSYRSSLTRARVSFRPAEVSGRVTSWRKDDSRLHVDSFPATPTGGCRILRLFSNVNPEGRPRTWRIAGEFEPVARRFAPGLRVPWPGTARLLTLARITKTRRTPYDALMLQLHDAMKADVEFQRSTPQTLMDFPAGTTWLAFTDQVGHAATAGQYQLEQTCLVPVEAMRDPDRSPLRTLERLKGRRLV